MRGKCEESVAPGVRLALADDACVRVAWTHHPSSAPDGGSPAGSRSVNSRSALFQISREVTRNMAIPRSHIQNPRSANARNLVAAPILFAVLPKVSDICDEVVADPSGVPTPAIAFEVARVDAMLA